jgi:two-component system, response regulator PdtaR
MDKISILIVEDEGIVAEDLKSKLKQLGYKLAGIAAESKEAVEMALRLKPQLILMDIQLDGPNDGIQTAEMIQALYDVPVIYLTAHLLDFPLNDPPFSYYFNLPDFLPNKMNLQRP